MDYFKADLHLHSVLSPCGDLLMTPQNIINRALEIGLDMMAITDHNSAENIEVTMDLAQGTGIKVIPGMEVETAEEVHLLCLFDSLEQMLKWQGIVYNALPDIKNNEEVFGPQLLTNRKDDFIKRVDKLLLTATNLTIDQVLERVNNLGGIVIPSHVDKTNYSIISNLGFIPPDLEFLALEISKNITQEEFFDKFNTIKKHTLITNSDAHYLEDIKKSTLFFMEDISISEIKLALEGVKGRKVELL